MHIRIGISGQTASGPGTRRACRRSSVTAERDGNYITNFFHFQPALNYGFAKPDPKHPWQQPVDAPGPQAVRRELKNIMKFWLDLGASGFRVDMAGSLVKNDPGNQETARLWQELRAWLDEEYPEAALVSEWSNPTVAIPAGFHMDFLLPFASPAYQTLFQMANIPGSSQEASGSCFFNPDRPGDIQPFLDDYLPLYQATRGKGFIVIPSGNHDTTPRLGNGRTPRDLELAFLFLLSMPGVPFIYYGDEIGMHSPDGYKIKRRRLWPHRGTYTHAMGHHQKCRFFQRAHGPAIPAG